MGKPKVPSSKGATDRIEKQPGTDSEKEPVHPERSAKKDQEFKTVETKVPEGKESVPEDSTAQRGKTPVSTSEEEKKKKNSEDH